MRYRRFRRMSHCSNTTFIITSVAVFTTVINICLIFLYLFSVPSFRLTSPKSFFSYSNVNSFPPLFNLNATDPEPDCGESKGKVLRTGWILKLVDSATRALRNYRKRELERMESGMDPNGNADIFTDLQPILAAFTGEGAKPDLLSMLPKIMALYGKIKQSGMFDADGRNGMARMNGKDQRPEHLPLVDFGMLEKLLALKNFKRK